MAFKKRHDSSSGAPSASASRDSQAARSRAIERILLADLFSEDAGRVERAIASAPAGMNLGRALDPASGCDALMSLLAASNRKTLFWGEDAVLPCVELLAPISDLTRKHPRSGKTALMFALDHRKLACAAQLLPLSDLSQRDAEGRSPLDFILGPEMDPRTAPEPEELGRMLRSLVSQISPAPSQWGRLAIFAIELSDSGLLAQAAEHCELKTLRAWRAPSAEMPDGEASDALFFAAAAESAGVLSVLLQEGCDPDAPHAAEPGRDDSLAGFTALMRAVFASGQEVMQGAGDDFFSPHPESAHRLACVRALAQASAPDARDARGNAALHLAAQHGCAESLKILLACGHNPNAQNAEGSTPLHLAAEWSEMGLVNPCLGILAETTDGSIKADTGLTPFQAACESQNIKALDILLSRMRPREAAAALASALPALFPLAARTLEASQLEQAMDEARKSPPTGACDGASAADTFELEKSPPASPKKSKNRL